MKQENRVKELIEIEKLKNKKRIKSITLLEQKTFNKLLEELPTKEIFRLLCMITPI